MKLEKAILFNPPVGLYQRGEDRCQAEVDGGSAISLRPPNDLGYIASMLKQIGVTPSIKDDMKAFSIAKSINPNIFTIAKGAHFFTCNKEDLKEVVFDVMDAAIVGEAETIINNLIIAKRRESDLNKVRGILFKNHTGQIIQTEPEPFWTNLDKIQVPARD